MKKLALGAALCITGFLAACGGGDDGGDGVQPVIDAAMGTVDAPPAAACNPLSPAGQQGCATGQKCTWIEVADTPDPLGKLGCVPDGTVALGGQCTRGAVGEATGYDNCAAGGICIGGATSGTCKDICGFGGGANDACEQGSACTRYADLFANGDEDPVAGACEKTCDPLKQTQLVNGQEQSCGANRGCYLLASTVDTIAVCAGAGMPTHNQPITGTTYANSCAPGHVPRQAVQGQMGNECAGLCKPADVYDGMNDGRNGRPDYEGGDTRSLNWKGEGANCVSAGGATVAPNVPTTGENCTYYWTREPSDNITNFSNTLGWCFQVQAWKYDPDGMEPINNTAAYPRCTQPAGAGQPAMTTMDLIPPMGHMPPNDAIYFGCMALPTMLTNAGRNAVKWTHRFEPKMDRLATYKY